MSQNELMKLCSSMPPEVVAVFTRAMQAYVEITATPSMRGGCIHTLLTEREFQHGCVIMLGLHLVRGPLSSEIPSDAADVFDCATDGASSLGELPGELNSPWESS